MIDIRKLAFIGGGNMAAALIGGLIGRGLAPARIVVADPNSEQRQKLMREHGVLEAADNAECGADAEVLVLAVKPQQMRAGGSRRGSASGSAQALGDIRGGRHPARGAGLVVRSREFRSCAQCRTGPRSADSEPPVCTRPATSAPRAARSPSRSWPPSGITVWVELESQMDTVTALSGSGPAYFFLFMEALEAARTAPRTRARGRAPTDLETALGAAVKWRASRPTRSPLLREQVTSKGGTTAAALAVLDAADLRGIVAHAVAAADRRSAELAADYGDP
jgi:pyrroline-5-carboxylate reductase